VIDRTIPSCFTLGAKGIYFIPKADETGLSAIQFYSLVTGKTKRIVSLPKDKDVGWSLDGSPDERWILCTLGEGFCGSDLMSVENFRRLKKGIKG
jgi:hypothetical protein